MIYTSAEETTPFRLVLQKEAKKYGKYGKGCQHKNLQTKTLDFHI